MIHLTFSIQNPWRERFENLWCRPIDTPFKNKCIEVEVCKDSNIVYFSLSWKVQRDHAGLDFEIGLVGYSFHFMFYDTRHWDYENNCWENNSG